jgi:hypothetical protein
MVRSCSAVFVFLTMVVGCRNDGHKGDDLPTLFPVKGQVVKNGVAVKGGSISFVRLNEQTPLIVISDVDGAGSFELATVQGRKKIPGAPEGEYHATYSPPVLGKDAFPVTPPQTFAVARGPNEIRIDVGQDGR